MDRIKQGIEFVLASVILDTGQISLPGFAQMLKLNVPILHMQIMLNDFVLMLQLAQHLLTLIHLLKDVIPHAQTHHILEIHLLILV